MTDQTLDSLNSSEISNNLNQNQSWKSVKYNLLEYSRKIAFDSELDELVLELERSKERLLSYKKFYNDYVINLEKTIKDLDIRLNLQISRSQMLEDSLNECQESIKLFKNNCTCKKSKSKLFGLF